jgi:hypothetical protein
MTLHPRRRDNSSDPFGDPVVPCSTPFSYPFTSPFPGNILLIFPFPIHLSIRRPELFPQNNKPRLGKVT